MISHVQTNIDKIMCAELPYQNEKPLHDLVLKHMSHKKCGKANTNSLHSR